MFTRFVLIILLLTALRAALPARAELAVGDRREKVIAALGEPEAQVKKRGHEVLYYGPYKVELSLGVVVAVDDDIENAVAAMDSRRATPPPTPRPRAASVATAPGGPGGEAIQKISKGGEKINLESLLVPGKVTIIDFYADWCAPCRRMAPHLEKMARDDPDIYLRQVDIVKWSTPVARQFNIRSIPSVRVFDRKGQMVGRPTPKLPLIEEYVRRAK